MTYARLQQRIYDNKVRRNFNVTDIGKEIILMTEENGELADAHLTDDDDEILDAVGDLMLYCLGLSAMFRWNADEVIKVRLKEPEDPHLGSYLSYVTREAGWLAKTYKTSNKLPVNEIDQRDRFRTHIGNLMGYCHLIFDYLNADETAVLEEIVRKNETREHEGKI